MVYDHTVIKNGIVYTAGQNVPENKVFEKPETEHEGKEARRGRPPKTEE